MVPFLNHLCTRVFVREEESYCTYSIPAIRSFIDKGGLTKLAVWLNESGIKDESKKRFLGLANYMSE